MIPRARSLFGGRLLIFIGGIVILSFTSPHSKQRAEYESNKMYSISGNKWDQDCLKSPQVLRGKMRGGNKQMQSCARSHRESGTLAGLFKTPTCVLEKAIKPIKYRLISLLCVLKYTATVILLRGLLPNLISEPHSISFGINNDARTAGISMQILAITAHLIACRVPQPAQQGFRM